MLACVVRSFKLYLTLRPDAGTNPDPRPTAERTLTLPTSLVITASRTSWLMDSTPPVTSSSVVQMFHPAVDCARLLMSTCSGSYIYTQDRL